MMPGTVKVQVTIDRDQLAWLQKNKFDLSFLVHAHLKELIRSIEVTKQGIAVPAAVLKTPDDDTLRKKLKKTPHLRRVLGP